MPVAAVAPSYTAPWPKGMEPTKEQIYKKRVWDLVSLIIFPIGLGRLGYYALQSLAGRVIHPAASDQPLDLPALREQMIQNGGEEVFIGTPDGEVVNGMLFRGNGERKGVIVKTFGNNATYERAGQSFVNFVRHYVSEDVDVVLLDTRGCGKSTGTTSPLGLSMDAFAAGMYFVQHEGYTPDKVFFCGHSLGGYTAVSGAGLLQKEFPDAKVSALSDRSFICLTDCVKAMMGEHAAKLISVLDWELDAREAWEMLKGHKIVVHDKNDQLPAHFVDYVHASGQKQNVWEVEMKTPHELEANNPGLAHNRGYTEDEGQAIGEHIRAALQID